MTRNRPAMTAVALSAAALLASGSLAFAADEEAAESASPDTDAQSQAEAQTEAVSEIQSDEYSETSHSGPYPLSMYEGTCSELQDVKFPLGEISTDLMVHGEAATSGDAEAAGGLEDQEVAVNVTLIAASLDDVTGDSHALAILESEEQMDARIACGDIAGTIIADDSLVIRLDQAHDSGYLGVALFTDEGDGNTTVWSMLTKQDAKVESPQMTSEETPEPEESEAPDEGTTEDEMSPAPDEGTTEDEMSPAPDEGTTEDEMSPAPDEGTGDDVTVVVEVDLEDGEDPDVDVDVEEPSESPEA